MGSSIDNSSNCRDAGPDSRVQVSAGNNLLESVLFSEVEPEFVKIVEKTNKALSTSKQTDSRQSDSKRVATQQTDADSRKQDLLDSKKALAELEKKFPQTKANVNFQAAKAIIDKDIAGEKLPISAANIKKVVDTEFSTKQNILKSGQAYDRGDLKEYLTQKEKIGAKLDKLPLLSSSEKEELKLDGHINQNIELDGYVDHQQAKLRESRSITQLDMARVYAIQANFRASEEHVAKADDREYAGASSAHPDSAKIKSASASDVYYKEARENVSDALTMIAFPAIMDLIPAHPVIKIGERPLLRWISANMLPKTGAFVGALGGTAFIKHGLNSSSVEEFNTPTLFWKNTKRAMFLDTAMAAGGLVHHVSDWYYKNKFLSKNVETCAEKLNDIGKAQVGKLNDLAKSVPGAEKVAEKCNEVCQVKIPKELESGLEKFGWLKDVFNKQITQRRDLAVGFKAGGNLTEEEAKALTATVSKELKAQEKVLKGSALDPKNVLDMFTRKVTQFRNLSSLELLHFRDVNVILRAPSAWTTCFIYRLPEELKKTDSHGKTVWWPVAVCNSAKAAVPDAVIAAGVSGTLAGGRAGVTATAEAISKKTGTLATKFGELKGPISAPIGKTLQWGLSTASNITKEFAKWNAANGPVQRFIDGGVKGATTSLPQGRKAIDSTKQAVKSVKDLDSLRQEVKENKQRACQGL